MTPVVARLPRRGEGYRATILLRGAAGRYIGALTIALYLPVWGAQR